MTNNIKLEDLSEFEKFKQTTSGDIEDFKGHLRELGNKLRLQIRTFKQRFDKKNIAFDKIDEGSKIINKSEEKLGNYLSMITKNERINDRYRRIKHVKKTYETKLAVATTAWLQKYNLHVIELTSYNRAKRTAESLVGVFQNQWQEMYTSSRNKLIKRYTDREIVEKLRDILKYCYDRCRDFYWKQGIVLLSLLTLSTGCNLDTCHPVIRLRIKELLKLGVTYTLPYIQKIIRQDVLSLLESNIVVRAHQRIQRPPIRSFLDICTEITWLMQLQDPPIVLDFTNENSSMKFKPYVTSGPEFVYVVWPAVLLHENGLLVSKGVAEFFNPGYEPSSAGSYDFG